MIWNETSKHQPLDNVVVETKNVSPNGEETNKQDLVKKGNLWWYTDSSMYVYYTPTHWRYKN